MPWPFARRANNREEGANSRLNIGLVGLQCKPQRRNGRLPPICGFHQALLLRYCHPAQTRARSTARAREQPSLWRGTRSDGGRRGCTCGGGRRRATGRARSGGEAWQRGGSGRGEKRGRHVGQGEGEDQDEDDENDQHPRPRQRVAPRRQRAAVARCWRLVPAPPAAPLIGHASPITKAAGPAGGRRVATSIGPRAWPAPAARPTRPPRSGRHRA